MFPLYGNPTNRLGIRISDRQQTLKQCFPSSPHCSELEIPVVKHGPDMSPASSRFFPQLAMGPCLIVFDDI